MERARCHHSTEKSRVGRRLQEPQVSPPVGGPRRGGLSPADCSEPDRRGGQDAIGRRSGRGAEKRAVASEAGGGVQNRAAGLCPPAVVVWLARGPPPTRAERGL